ncbi:MAG: hypothetical protein J6J00_01300 [Treponema sp.]|nr:hypothetical protein [Treponema sp.]
MKKIIAFVFGLCLLGSLSFAQVLKSNGVKNTLSTTFGQPYGEVGDSDRFGLRYYGFVETLQARIDISKFTVEGMLNWGALTNWDTRGAFDSLYFANTSITPFWYTNHFDQGGWWTNGDAESYYVNFLFHPIKGLDLGMGTRLEWKIGPAPSSLGNYWEPLAHIVQGGLKDAAPGGADVAGYTYYANTYTALYRNNTKAALGLRYRYEDFLEVGISIPSGVTTNAPLFNAAFMIHPVDFFTASIAYEGILQSNGNFYTGLSLFFKPMTLDAYLAIDFREKGDYDLTDQRWGTGAAVTFIIPKTSITLRPEGGISVYSDANYTMAWYAGARIDIPFANSFVFGAWSSFAVGASDVRWHDKSSWNYNPDYSGGFVFDVRPDLTWKINGYNSLTVFFDFQSRKAYYGKLYDVWATGLYWTFQR